MTRRNPSNFIACIACFLLVTACGFAPAARAQTSAPVSAIPSPADVSAFAAEVNLIPFGQLAVHSEGRVKSFDSHARAAMQFISGSRKIEGRSAAFTYLDMMLRAEAYADVDAIYFKQKQMRVQVAQALREGLRADLESMPAEMRTHIEEQMTSVEQRLETFIKTGLLSRRMLSDPRVQDLLSRLSTDLLRSAKFVEAIQSALNVMDPEVLRIQLKFVPPVSAIADESQQSAASQDSLSEADRAELLSQPWLTLDDLSNPRAAAVTSAIDADLRRQLVDAWTAFTTSWQSLNASGVNAAAVTLVELLPKVNTALYPDQSRLAWESWYFRAKNMTWVWLIYAFAIVPLLLAVVYRWPAARWIGLFMFLLAFGFHTFAVMLRWYVADRWPNSNMFEAVTTAAWFGGCLALVLELLVRRLPMRNIFALGSAVASLTALMAVHFSPLTLSADIRNMMPVLDDVWLYIHTNVIIFSYCLIFIAAVTATMYLCYRFAAMLGQWPRAMEYARVGGAGSLILTRADGSSYVDEKRSTFGQVLDGTTMVLMELAFITLWAGLVMGAIWADHSWGRPWGWDPKEVFALNTFIVFLLLVHVRLKVKDKGLWTAILAVIGAAVMLFNWIIINFAISGLHSYA